LIGPPLGPGEIGNDRVDRRQVLAAACQMCVMTIDKTKADRVVFTCPHELRQMITDYRRSRPDLPPESKAIADLIRKGLEAFGQAGKTEEKGRKP
jgi:hypothetical protein